MENVLVCVSPSFQNSVSLGQVICQICPHQWKTENGYIYAPIPQWHLKYKQTIQYIFQYFFFFLNLDLALSMNIHVPWYVHGLVENLHVPCHMV